MFALRLVVTATDRGTPRLAGSATLTVIVTDLNDNSPMIPLPQEIHVPESKSALHLTFIPEVQGGWRVNYNSPFPKFHIYLTRQKVDMS